MLSESTDLNCYEEMDSSLLPLAYCADVYSTDAVSKRICSEDLWFDLVMGCDRNEMWSPHEV